MARVVDWKRATLDTETTLARFVVLDDGSYREVHLSRFAQNALSIVGGIEGSGLSTAAVLERLEQLHLIYGSRSLWATEPYDLPDADAIAGDIRGV